MSYQLRPRQSEILAATLPTIRIKPDLLTEIQRSAERAGITTSEAVRQILAAWVERQRKGE